MKVRDFLISEMILARSSINPQVPPGIFVTGTRYKRADYFNRLTNYDTIWKKDDSNSWFWDWFDYAVGEDNPENYHKSLKDLKHLFPDDVWNEIWSHVRKKPIPDEEVNKNHPWKNTTDITGSGGEGDLGENILMKELFEKYLSEAGMITGGYPDDGSTGPASDDDRPPGNILVAPRYERSDYFNKLTSYNTIWKHDEKGGWTWDWFENATGQDDPDNYDKTLGNMKKLFPDDTWEAAWSAVRKREVPSKEVDIRFDDKGQPYRKSGDVLGKHDDAQGGESDKEAKVPSELDSDDKGVTNEMSVLDRIDKLLIDGCKKKKLTESTVAKTILKQINAIDKWALQSWGAKNYVSSDKSIQFDVRGSKFRGRVIITYDRGPDTYVVELGQVKNLDWKQKYMMKNIFAQDLVNVLDQQIG
jgi:hypothetical protein